MKRVRNVHPTRERTFKRTSTWKFFLWICFSTCKKLLVLFQMVKFGCNFPLQTALLIYNLGCVCVCMCGCKWARVCCNCNWKRGGNNPQKWIVFETFLNEKDESKLLTETKQSLLNKFCVYNWTYLKLKNC